MPAVLRLLAKVDASKRSLLKQSATHRFSALKNEI